jgi:hypothetical protein
MIGDPQYKAMQLELISLKWRALHGDQRALRELREKIVHTASAGIRA